jgi:hypothetical protein
MKQFKLFLFTITLSALCQIFVEGSGAGIYACSSSDEWFGLQTLSGGSNFGVLYWTSSGVTLTAYTATFATGTVYTFQYQGWYETV